MSPGKSTPAREILKQGNAGSAAIAGNAENDQLGLQAELLISSPGWLRMEWKTIKLKTILLLTEIQHIMLVL